MNAPTNPGRPLSAREFFSLPTSDVPFIPELHTDDCDDTSCVRCTPTIDRLDVPAEQVALEAVLRETVARHTAARDWDEDEVVAAAEAIRLVTHPDAPMPSDTDNPEWAAWLATQIELNKQARRTR